MPVVSTFSQLSASTYLNGARFGIPSLDMVDTNAMGRGTIAEVINLYASLVDRDSLYEMGALHSML